MVDVIFKNLRKKVIKKKQYLRLKKLISSILELQSIY